METRETILKKIAIGGGMTGAKAIAAGRKKAMRSNELNFLETGDIILHFDSKEAMNEAFAVIPVGKSTAPAFVANVKRGDAILPIIVYMSQFTKGIILGREEVDADGKPIAVKVLDASGNPEWRHSGGTVKDVALEGADTYEAYCKIFEKNQDIDVTVHKDDSYARDFVNDTYYIKKDTCYFDFDFIPNESKSSKK